MTFTEAAVEVLRQAGKPLHYKKITELAIEQNLLSHVGKTPETTMSSRLSTMVKKDRGDAPIMKVKPGVFALRDGADEAPAEDAAADSAQDDNGDDSAVEEAAEASAAEDAEEAADATPAPQLPGADVFPEEEDDDELILANLDSDDGERGRSRRRRGSRRRRDEDDRERPSRGRDNNNRRGGRRNSRDQARAGSRRQKQPLEGDWNRRPNADEPAGEELAYAIAKVLKGGRREPATLRRVAERLVSSGRLSGKAEALLPTLAAAVRGDDARRRAEGLRPRFRLVGDEVSLSDWALPSEAVRAENDVLKAAKRQRDSVRRALIRRLRDMPDAALLELIATWLNARGVTSIRGVRATDSGFNLAGVLRRGPEEVPLAIVVYRKNVERDHVVDVRGALHHFGQAKVAWLISLGRVESSATEEAGAEGAAPCALFDGDALAESLEEAGVGIRAVHVPIATLDIDLLESLEGPASARDARDDEDSDEERDEGSNGRRKRSGRRRGRRRGGADRAAADNDEASASGDDADRDGSTDGESEAGDDGAEAASSAGDESLQDAASGDSDTNDGESDPDSAFSSEDADSNTETEEVIAESARD